MSSISDNAYNNNPRVTVLIAMYNAQKFIIETIRSILNQTYQDFEIVIVNDGSRDNSVQLVERIKDPRIRIVSQETSGPHIPSSVWS